ncbi:hypothetical protein ACQRXC_29145 (plasmid) [Niallia taxi]|uniref:hypothetical protein n=1 Tax=Niallia taxi TaxID=2499688 RepID=UPI003F5FDF1D
MIKTAIRYYDNNRDAHLIFHATPSYPPIDPYSLYKHQWYLTEDKKVVGTPLEEEEYEMYLTNTEQIGKNGFDGLYLYCKRIDIKTNEENNTEFIKLSSDFNTIIESGTIFDDISSFDKNGDFMKK